MTILNYLKYLHLGLMRNEYYKVMYPRQIPKNREPKDSRFLYNRSIDNFVNLLQFVDCREIYMLVIITKFATENVESTWVLRIFLYLYAKRCFIGFLKFKIAKANAFIYQFFIKKYTCRSNAYVGEDTVFCAFRIPPARCESSVSVSVISG